PERKPAPGAFLDKLQNPHDEFDQSDYPTRQTSSGLTLLVAASFGTSSTCIRPRHPDRVRSSPRSLALSCESWHTARMRYLFKKQMKVWLPLLILIPLWSGSFLTAHLAERALLQGVYERL